MFCFTNSILVPVRVNLLLWTRKAILRSAQLSWLVDWFPERVAGLCLWGAMCQSKLPRKPSRLIQVCRNVVNNDEVEVWSFEFNWVGRTRSGFVQNFIFAFWSLPFAFWFLQPLRRIASISIPLRAKNLCVSHLLVPKSLRKSLTIATNTELFCTHTT